MYVGNGKTRKNVNIGVGWLVGRYVQVSTSIYVVLDGRLVDTRASVAPRQTPTIPTPQLE